MPTESKKIGKYIRGFPEGIKGNMISSKPATLHEAINMARALVEQSVQGKAARISESNKRKWEDNQRNTNNNNHTTTKPQHNRTATETTIIPSKTKQETGKTCQGICLPAPAGGKHLCWEIYKYNRFATYIIMDRLSQRDTSRDKVQKARNQQNEGARGRAYVVVENPQQNPNVVTGTFLLNDHYACILFDSGAEKSFVSSAFTPFIDIAPTALNTSYEVELADRKVVSTNTILRSCTLVLLNHVFKIDLLPTRLGSFDVIIGMDWLAYHRALIDCYEKIVRIPLSNGKILEVQGERPEKDLRSLACIKADKKKLDDIRVVRDFPEVFPDDLLGLPLVREIEFRIDLIPGASPVVRSPYRLELPQELSRVHHTFHENIEIRSQKVEAKLYPKLSRFVGTLGKELSAENPAAREIIIVEIGGLGDSGKKRVAGSLKYERLELNPTMLVDLDQQILKELLHQRCAEIEQGVQAKALRIGDSNKRKWEDQQGNNHHQQQNRRQEVSKIYVAAPAKGRGYVGNLPWCNRCKAHHHPGLCPPRLELPQELSRVHHTFHVSNFDEVPCDETIVVSLDGLHIDDKLYFIKENIEIRSQKVEAKLYPKLSRFVGTLGKELSIPGKSNTNSEEISDFFLEPVLSSSSQLELEGQGHLTGRTVKNRILINARRY
ncbi:putative reverse transcriptase domain-containing protein [Tanacetum coccineum]